MVTCPMCDGAIDVDEEEVDEGDILSCDECGAELKVAGKNPLELVSNEEDEDEEDEDLEDDEEEEEVEEEEEKEDEWK